MLEAKIISAIVIAFFVVLQEKKVKKSLDK